MERNWVAVYGKNVITIHFKEYTVGALSRAVRSRVACPDPSSNVTPTPDLSSYHDARTAALLRAPTVFIWQGAIAWFSTLIETYYPLKIMYWTSFGLDCEVLNGFL